MSEIATSISTQQKHIAEQLVAQRKTLAIAESCTGGSLVQVFTRAAGASQYLKGGVVTYATQSKIDVLGIPETLIQAHTVVSAAVAEAMAQQVLALYKSDFSIATTGNAGPSKGDSSAAVGTVFVAIASKDKVYSKRFCFENTRQQVIERSVEMALKLLDKEIFENK